MGAVVWSGPRDDDSRRALHAEPERRPRRTTGGEGDMLTRYIKRQLLLFSIITVIALVTLGWYYLRLPTLVGTGESELKPALPASGGLYPTANVTYRGITIGKVTDVEPTQHGAQATMSIA